LAEITFEEVGGEFCRRRWRGEVLSAAVLVRFTRFCNGFNSETVFFSGILLPVSLHR
jgi:hypothetical protein